MACSNIFDAFRVATEHLGPEIYRLAAFNDPFINLIPRSIFSPNSGLTHSVFRVNKNEPTEEDNEGQSIVLANGSNSGACSPTYTDVSVGFDEFTYTPYRLAWRGPLFCKDDQYFNHAPDQFINGYVEELAEYVRKDVNNHLFYHYARRVPIYVADQNCFNVSTSPVGSGNALTAPQAVSELTQEMLDTLAQQLIWERATNPDSSGYIQLGPDGPIFSLLLGLEASQLITLNNAEFRQDIRWAEPSQLMKRLGANRVIKNFRHVPWVTPARFTYAGGAYVRVPTYVSASSTKGTRTSINPNWISPTTAPYEAAVVLSPYVMTSELIKPKANVGGLNWKDTSYMGDWSWLTGPEAVATQAGDACFDPLHKQGRHYAEFMHALRPGALVNSGAIVFFARCAASCTNVTCT